LDGKEVGTHFVSAETILASELKKKRMEYKDSLI